MKDIVGGYRILDKLSQGHFGAVFTARHKESSRAYALRLVECDTLTGAKEAVGHFNKLKELDDYCTVLSYVDAFTDIQDLNVYVCVVTPFEDGPTLNDYVLQHQGVSDEELGVLLCDLSEGLAFLHKNNITHGGLTPSNVLLWTDDVLLTRAKIADFGMARVCEHLEEWTYGGNVYKYFVKRQLGAQYFLPPECWRGTEVELLERVDVFSLGAVICATLLHTSVNVQNRRILACFVLSGEGHLPLWHDGAAEVLQLPETPINSLLRKMLKADPKQRPDANEVLHVISKAFGKSTTKAPRRYFRTRRLCYGFFGVVAAAFAVGIGAWNAGMFEL
ncbi:serine/threonine-protein kinase pdik1l-B-like [Branchiostoma floridae]|uniref:non-specific serine/threonine protein kinase n=1 Tax=Branchiostoma floridae TaxID=7739 RepID=A0A9J7LQ80_BRAFL|nr:serine/threonine-protein kinase pdik1l-B-like [Branchiostoma floridae]